MSHYEHVTSISVAANADLRTKIHCFVKYADDTNSEIALCGDGQDACGVLLNDPNTSEAGEVAIAGVTKVIAGGTISAGGLVSSDASGHAVAAGTADYILGKTMRDCVSGDVVSVHLNFRGTA